MAECGKPVGQGTVAYPCIIEGGGHLGPCMARENARSVRQREQWEAEQRHVASGLGEFQGRPQTTAERYTDPGSTVPHPGAVAPEFEPDAALAHPGTEAPQDGPQEPPQQRLAPTRTRPGDQPLPVVNDEMSIQDRVIADIEQRKRIGLERYGTLLQPFNGRNAVQDLYEELLDAAMYAKQVLVEWDSMIADVQQLRADGAEMLRVTEELRAEVRGAKPTP